MLSTSVFLKENLPISLEEWILVFKVLTTKTRKLRVKQSQAEAASELVPHQVRDS